MSKQPSSSSDVIVNYRKIPYARVSRPIWPLDEVTTPGLVGLTA